MTFMAPAFTDDPIATEHERLRMAEVWAREACWDAKTHAQRVRLSAEAEEARLALAAFRAEHSL
jgi:hypothetical protein